MSGQFDLGDRDQHGAGTFAERELLVSGHIVRLPVFRAGMRIPSARGTLPESSDG
jgi:hypothetical protein